VSTGTEVLPVPLRHSELGFIIAGRVRLTPLPQDYDPAEIDLDSAGMVLGEGDAFSWARGERVMIEVLEDLTFNLCPAGGFRQPNPRLKSVQSFVALPGSPFACGRGALPLGRPRFGHGRARRLPTDENPGVKRSDQRPAGVNGRRADWPNRTTARASARNGQRLSGPPSYRAR